MYEKAREYAREVTLLFLTVQAMRCARNGITTIKNVFQNKADLLSVLRRKGTTSAKEILENPTELEILLPETGAELFASYKGLLEEEAITAYEKKVTQYPLEKGRDLKSIIQKAAGKLERKLTKSELEKILRWQDEEVAEEIICDRLYSGHGSITVNDAQRLVDKFAGTGEWIGTNKERVYFLEIIGQYVNPVTGDNLDTTVGIIHYSKTGTHIVP